MMDEYGLTPKQRAWCDEYIKTGNGIDAARKAGYKQPKTSADNNREKRAVQAYIAARMQPTVDKRIADADEVLLFLSRTMRGEIKDQFGLDASLQDRIKAGQELMKRYAVADMRQVSTMQKLDSIFLEFKAAISSENAANSENAVIVDNAGGMVDADSTRATALPPATAAQATPGDSTTTATAQPATAATQGTGGDGTTISGGPLPTA